MVQFPGSIGQLLNQGRAPHRSGSQALLWRCPLCSGALILTPPDRVACADCRTAFPSVDGIPDLRIRDSSHDIEPSDLDEARALSAEFGALGPESIITGLFARRAWDAGTKALRVRQTLASPNKLRPELDGWLRRCLVPDGILLDVGCGAGGMLAAAAAMGYAGAGIDASMPLLVAAKHMIEAHGGTAMLACAYAESLPLASESIGAVTLYDVIEHVDDVGRVLADASRVLRPGGYLAISTPNRFSVAAEPHVFLWGVGWLPRRLQEPYVRLRGRAYHGTRLLSAREMARLLESHQELDFELRAPPVPEEEIRHFGARRAALARLYNRVAAQPISRKALLGVGPFFQVIARRRSAVA
jgi:2-polyprenyl-3-methyl-5-hydroxy-6-metoxy-1,4-benzoquinol methylase